MRSARRLSAPQTIPAARFLRRARRGAGRGRRTRRRRRGKARAALSARRRRCRCRRPRDRDSGRKLENFLGGVGAELADGVEDPEERDAEVAGAAGTASIEAFEDGGKILFAPEADSDRDIDFGVQHAFFFQPLHQAVGDEFVVFRRAQVLCDVLEGEQEPGKSS